MFISEEADTPRILPVLRDEPINSFHVLPCEIERFDKFQADGTASFVEKYIYNMYKASKPPGNISIT